MWGVVRERRVLDTLGVATVTREWVQKRQEDGLGLAAMTFPTQAEAQRTAGVWNVLRDGWRYEARQIQ